MYSSYGLDAYNTGYSNSGADAFASLFAGSVVGMIFGGILGIAVIVVMLIALYKLFQKAGRKGYEALISGHETFVLFQMAGINPIWCLGIVFGSIVCIIPILGYIAYIAFLIFILVWLNLRLAKAFGKETGFGVLMFFFPYVMYPILAFGDAKYTAPSKVVNKPGEDK